MALRVPTDPKVDHAIFLGFLWGGTTLSFLFVIFRLGVRLRTFRTLLLDDAFVVTAWLLLLANSIIWQTQAPAMYHQFRLAAGTLLPTPDILAAESTFLRSIIAILINFLTGLYAVKASFLAFFKHLDQQHQGPRRWWWRFVAALTVLAWLSSVGAIQYRCLFGDLLDIMTECTGDDALRYQHASLIYQCSIDLITDVLLMSIPAIMLWHVRMASRTKIALLGIFSLTLFIMAVSIVRVALNQSDGETVDVTWLYFWTHLETAVAVIVSCLASFRQLFVAQSRSTGSDRDGSRDRFRAPVGSGSRTTGRLLVAASDEKRTSSLSPVRSSRPPSREDAASLNDVHISRGFDVHFALRGASGHCLGCTCTVTPAAA